MDDGTGPGGLAAFAGRWTLSRRIEDATGRVTGRLSGSAVFAPADGGLDYTEDGELVLPGQGTFHATRRYLWRDAGAGRVEVLFDDGRPFHALDLSAPVAEASHWCDPDAYAVRLDLSDWPRWRSEWRVRGPRKDYRMVSDYARP